MYFFFSLYLRFIILVHGSCDYYSCTLFLCSLYSYVCFSFHLSIHVLFLFFLYTHASYIMYAIYYFCFTQRYRDEFCLKCSKNTGCHSFSCHRLSSYKVFQKFVLVQILLYSTSKYELSDLWLLSYLICQLCFCHELPNAEIVRTYVFYLLGTYVTIHVIG